MATKATNVNGHDSTENPRADFGPGHPFTGAEIVSTYGRAQAIKDGVLADVSELAREAGFTFPVAITEGLHQLLTPSEIEAERHGQSYEGRLWDVLTVLKAAIRHANQGDARVDFTMSMMGEKARKIHDLYALCHPGDTDAAVITIMLAGED